MTKKIVLKYDEILESELSYEAIKELVSQKSPEIDKLLNAILYYATNDVNFELAQKLCILYYNSPIKELKYISIVCIGHIARVYKKLVDEQILENITKMAFDSHHEFYGVADDTLDDIEMFAHIKNLLF